MQVLFLNMESDIGAAGAFVFAHKEAIQGMHQMLHQIDVAYDCVNGEFVEAAQMDKELVQQVRIHCFVVSGVLRRDCTPLQN